MNLTLVIIQEAHEAVLPRLNSLKFRPNTKGKSATCAVRAFHTSSEADAPNKERFFSLLVLQQNMRLTDDMHQYTSCAPLW